MADTATTDTPAPVEIVPKPKRAFGRPFPKGVSGNPGGRSKQIELEKVKAAAREHGVEAIGKLVELMRGPNAKVSCMAAMAILDRGFGKPDFKVDTDGAAIGLIILPPEDRR